MITVALSTLAQERRAAWRESGQAALGLVMPCEKPVRKSLILSISSP